ncbi:ABC transporter related protein (modular protein) [Candidatus Promineifilum breve]|uniref:ABC transporter related protein (Modular protein) n=1 Tax=Candidatus Promineifilum breve TaxID=1806508 RepID=A0A160T3P6_9CHLR|nr:ABC transporter ATP-binding protein [Candidatus Promineifilum breve]CUS03265.2 ABC transporter related protein (modular protein) [Candidatus Promineifilum breve]
MSDLLTVRDLSKVFGTWSQTHAVDGVSFTMPATPTIVNLVGESGSGKSTISRMILGLEKPTSGSVLYKGQDIFAQNSAWRHGFRREVQVVFQDPYSAYNPIYKIERVFNLPIRRFGLASGKAESQEMIRESLRAVDLRPEEVLGKYPHQLSGGQRQRVMLARLHLIRPQLIIADEPISMIDASMQASFLNILLDFRDRLGISTLFITHDLSTARYLGGEILVLYKGRIAEHGATDSVSRQPHHPYARLLMESIPIADPRRRWENSLPPAPDIETATAAQRERRDRCLFAERCRFVMPVCWNARPGLIDLGDDPETGQVRTAVSCYLWNTPTESKTDLATAELEPAVIEKSVETM